MQHYFTKLSLIIQLNTLYYRHIKKVALPENVTTQHNPTKPQRQTRGLLHRSAKLEKIKTDIYPARAGSRRRLGTAVSVAAPVRIPALWLAARARARASPANQSGTRGRGAEALPRLNCDCFFCRKVCLARFPVFLSGGCIMEISRSPFPRPPPPPKHAWVGGGWQSSETESRYWLQETLDVHSRVVEIVEISILLRYYTLIPC